MTRPLLYLLLFLRLSWAQTWEQGPGAFDQGGFVGTQVDSLGRLALTSFQGANLAFGLAAVSGENPLTGSRSVTDGDPNTEWRFNNQAEVLGEWIKLDLGGDRGVSQVRIYPGKTLNQRPRFFLKGYRIEVAEEEAPDDWILVAQQVENTQPLIDTRVDSTWISWDQEGQPLPVLGRYVRVRIVREDPPNWVTIGEIEVYGEGYRAEGSYESAVFDAGRGVNFGQARFSGQTPEGTLLKLQFRTSLDSSQWAPWHQVPEWGMGAPIELSEPEPARFLQYRVSMETAHPLRTPQLEKVAVAYDAQLYATELKAGIAPLRPVLGAETLFTYTIDALIRPEDQGFDQVHLDLPGTVQEVRWERAVVPATGYAASWDAQGLRLELEPDHAVLQSGRLEVDFRGVLLRPTLAVRAGVALADTGQLNYQNAQPATEDAWTLVGRGQIGRTLARVQVWPNPFNAGRGPTQIQIDLANVQMPQPLSVGVYDLAGRRVRGLWENQLRSAGRQGLEWDGRDDQGRLVVPGLYLLRVESQADVGDVWVGSVGVVY